ncbi:MAG: AAA family ATPase [Rickettsiales bacterium]|nr:AAA family ATPase [Rickettsiales bacterium]
MLSQYAEKQKKFHDNFINYCLEEIKKQRDIASGRLIQHDPSDLEKKLRSLSKVPILKDTVDIVLLLESFWQAMHKPDATAIINNLFDFDSEYEIKLILSNAILKVSAEFEEIIDQCTDYKEIIKYSAFATYKLFDFLRRGHLGEKKLKERVIVDIIFRQDSWFEGDIFSKRARGCKYYRPISENELKGYIELKNRESGDITISLSEYLRHTCSIEPNLQIVLLEEVSVEVQAELDLSYENLNGHELYSDVFAIESIQKQINKLREIFDEPHTPSRCDFNNVPSPVQDFVGRTKELIQLHENIFYQTGKIQVIGGIRGVGKTEFILEFIQKYRVNDKQVRYFTAKDEITLKTAFEDFAEEVQLTKKVNNIIGSIKNWLKGLSTPSLLVFDNIDSSLLIEEFLRDGKRYKYNIIITTQSILEWEVIAPRYGIDIIELKPFDDSEVFQYVRKTIQDIDNRNALFLGKLFDNIPLGISQSLFFMKRNGIDIIQYLNEYDSFTNNLPFELPETLVNIEHGNDKLGIYQVLLNTITKLFSRSDVLDFLKICSYLNYIAIPDYLFSSMFNNIEINKILVTLKGHSLILLEKHGPTKIICLYKIVQRVIRFSLGDERLKYLRESAKLVESKMENSWNKQEIVSKNKPIIKHAISIINHYKDIKFEESFPSSLIRELDLIIAKLSYDCAKFYKTISEFHKALEFYEEALRTYEAYYQENNQPVIAVLLHEIGTVYARLGHNEIGLKYIEDSLQTYSNLFGKNSDYTKAAMSSLAKLLQTEGVYNQNTGNYNEALVCYKKLLAIQSELYNENNFEIIYSANLIVYIELSITLNTYSLSDEKYDVPYLIEMIKYFVGEEKMSTSPGLVGYMFNSLSNNQFFKPAEQLIKSIYSFINLIERLVYMSESYKELGLDDIDKKVSHFWEQLEELFYFLEESRYDFIRTPRPPSFDPEDDDYGDGSLSGGGTGGGNENIAEPMVISLNETVLNNNIFESDF